MSYLEKRLDKKAMANFKFLTSWTGEQIIEMHILPNIARSEGNQKMKLVQLIKYSV